jgi:ribosomal protein S18 acetylase RimI-like enzyme
MTPENFVNIRDARREDARFVAWTVLTALDMDETLLDKVAEVCGADDTLYSWRNARICDVDGAPAGCLISYEGSKYKEMRVRTWSRIWSDFSIEDFENAELETVDGEFYLDSMAVVEKYRGFEIGHLLMLDGVLRGGTANCEDVTLIVSVDKPRLQEYYGAIGFEVCGEINFFGHIFHRMRLKDNPLR